MCILYIMNIIHFILLIALFYVLTPGIFLSLPPKSGKKVVAITHAFVFAVVWTILYKPLCKITRNLGFYEGMETKEEKKVK